MPRLIGTALVLAVLAVVLLLIYVRTTDGELFYIIERGIRFTGMPAWSTGTPEGEESSWKLVHFIRYLPRITEADLERMKGMNPVPPESIRQQIAEEQFLGGAQ